MIGFWLFAVGYWFFWSPNQLPVNKLSEIKA